MYQQLSGHDQQDTFRSRRNFIRFALGLGLGLPVILAGCEFAADEPLLVASHVWVGYEPMFLARNEHWLDDKLVRLVETNAATDSLRALAEGKVAGAALTLDEVFKARQNGQKLTIVMVFDISAGADMLLARAGISEIADLKGKRIGYEQSSVGELLLSEILRIAGLSRSDVVLVPLSVDKHVEAWKHNEFDAAVTYVPVASELLGMGAVRLFDSRQIPNTIVDVLAIRSELLERHADGIRSLIRAHFKALDHLTRNPHDAAYRMAGRLKLPAQEVLPAFKGLLLPDAANKFRILGGNSPELLQTARKLSTVMVNSQLLKQEDDLSALIRADFLPLEFPQ